MAETSSSEIKVPALTQIGIVVKDLEKTMESYWNILGIGPWTVLTMEFPGMYGQTYHGKPACFSYKAGLTQVGPVEIELMENVEGTTTYSDFMVKHGEGGHHLQYLVDSVEVIDKHGEIMAKRGFPSEMSAHFGDNGGFNYRSTQSALKTIWEQVKMASEFIVATAKFPAGEEEVSPAKIKVRAITQISLVVKNLEEVMDNYWNLLGIGPWNVFECVPPILHDHTYHGKPGNFTMRAAVVMVGPVELELIQPLSGDSVYSDFMTEHGEGLNHVQFLVENVDETIEIMGKEGFALLQSGHVSDDYFSYYDTVGPLKIIWEAYQPPKTKPPMTRYP